MLFLFKRFVILVREIDCTVTVDSEFVVFISLIIWSNNKGFYSKNKDQIVVVHVKITGHG
jgi:hypothetical protein